MHRLSWKVALAVEVLAILSLGAVMVVQGAPAWAVTLLAFSATRASRIAVAQDAGAVQSTVRALRDDVERARAGGAAGEGRDRWN